MLLFHGFRLGNSHQSKTKIFQQSSYKMHLSEYNSQS